MTFSNINSGSGIEASDNSTKNFTVFATFKSTVTDNDNLKFTISSAKASSSGSGFTSSNAGGAATDNTGNNNKIEVSATKLLFETQPSNVEINTKMSPAPIVSFVDANNNLDVDISSSTYNVSLSTTSTFASGATTTVTPSAGKATFSNLSFSVANTNRTLTASEASGTFSNTTSNTFDVQNLVNPAVGTIYISEVCDASTYTNEFIELYNDGNDVCDLSTSKLKRLSGSGTIEATWDFTTDLSGLGSIKIPAEGYLVISRGAASQADFETEWGALPTGCYFNRGTTSMYFGASTARRWQLVYDDGSKAETIIDDSQNSVGGSGNDSKQLSDGNWTTTSNTNDGTPGTQDGDGSTLPIELINFKAIHQGDINLITWQTASELNNDYFVLESSINGIDFNEVIIIKSSGNSNEIQSYFAEDNTQNYALYYRLKQVDFDGTSSYSKVISINIINKGIEVRKIYTQGATLVLNLNGTHNSNAKISILSIDGKIVKKYNLNLNNNQSQYKLFIGNNLRGMYLIQIENGDKMISKKIVL